MGYWQDRQESMYRAGEMKVNQYFSKLERAFNQTRRELQKTVEAFYFRYAEENGLTFAEAQKRLDKAEIGELKDFIELSMENIGRYNQEVNNMSIKARMTRYQALEAQIDAMLRQLYAINYEAMAEQTMSEVYEDSYNRTWYNIDQYRGFHSAFAQVDERTVEKLLEYPFNGANFSSRLWKQKDHLQMVLMESVTTMLVQGVHPRTLTADFAKKMNTKKFEAYRLLHTEASFLMNEATHAGYKEDGVEKYQLLATLDSKTCGVCGELDSDIYLVSEAVVGKNMPPFHPLCRCTAVPYYDDTDLTDQTRAARDPETGKTYEVPAEMSYKEWKQTFIDKNVARKSESDIMKLSNTDLGAIMRYKSFDSYTINEKLRNIDNIEQLNDFDRQFVKELDEALLKVPQYHGDLIRTVDFSDYSDGEDRLNAFLEEINEGASISTNQYLSTSKTQGYSDTADVVIYIQNSSNGRDISSIGLDESEVLYERNIKFNVLRKDLMDGIWNILLEEV